jgi:uncharacterized protein YacL
LFIRLLNLAVFAIAGWRIGEVASLGDGSFVPWVLVFTLVGALIGGLVGPFITVQPLKRLLDEINRVPSSTLVSGTIGLVIGLVIAALFSIPFFQLDGWLNWGIPVAISGVLGTAGLALGIQRERELRGVIPTSSMSQRSGSIGQINGRILVDTSAIIDGRIADLSETGFVQGTLVIPRFVLDELRHIADSSDSLRRTRGRRGLEVLAKLRKDGDLPVQILDAEILNGAEVDGELVRLARNMKAHILTTDFNLNRVAELQGVSVLNVNELANALKPVVLPGEEIAANIIQEGKEIGQGVAFLDDGTMVVVEGGRRFINSVQSVTVTRVLQTAAGRIIFAQLRGPY